MPGEARQSFVAVDLARGQTRAYAQGQVLRSPAAVFAGEDGAVCFGEQALRRGLTAPEAFEPRLPEWIDDEYLALGAALYQVGDLLRGLLREAVSGVWPSPTPPDALVLVVPEYWGGPRRGVIGGCAEGLAPRVELLSSAKALLLGAAADRPGMDLRKPVVVEQEQDRAVAWALSPGGEALGSAVVDGYPCDGDGSELKALVRRAVGGGLAESALVIAPRGGRELSAALWAAVPAHGQIMDGDCALRGAVEHGNSLV